jgi:hypothetical protein
MSDAPVSPETANEEPTKVSRRWWNLWLCVGAYLLLAVALFWPAAPWSSSTLPAGFNGRGFGDPQQMTWFLEWVPYALRHGLDIFQSNFLDYPRTTDLADTTSVPLLGFLVAPVTLSLGPVAAFNILLRLAFASSATSMFFVLRSWCRTPAAFVGGLLFGFGPYMIDQGQNHLNLVFLPLLPLMVWCVYELLFTRKRSPVRVGLLLGVLAGAQILIDAEFLAMLAIVCALGCIGLALFRPRHLNENFRFLIVAAGPAILVFAAIAGFFVWSLVYAPGHLVGPVYPVKSLQSYRADLLEPIVPTVSQFIAPLSLAVAAFRFVGQNITEDSGYLSLPFVILFFWFSYRWRKNRVVVFSAWLAVAAFILALGSRLTIDGHVTSLPLPEALLPRISLLQNLVPARFAVLVALFAVIVVAVGLDRFLGSLAAHHVSDLKTRLADLGVITLVVAALALMFPLVPLSTQALPWSSATVTALNVIPPGSVVLAYPFPTSPWTEAMTWQAEEEMRFRLIGGYITTQSTPVNGESYPSLLSPKVVEETMIKGQFGTNVISGEQRRYPKPNPKADVQRALCTFLHRYKVGAVVFWKGGAYRGVDPSLVHRLFSSALGEPTRVGDHDKMLVWLTNSVQCIP